MNKLFWIDMEMTGLDVDTEVVIEVAVIITDLNFNELDQFECVVKQPQSYLEKMDDWNKEHHSKSGLLKKIPMGMDPEFVEVKLIDLVRKHFKEIPGHDGKNDNRPILAGNSITQDRLFIDKYFQEFSGLLHYRMLDVSSWKIIMANKFNYKFHKSNQHRALDDIRESINELKTYLQFVHVAPNS
ncbi:MAG: oligoribonuclease [Pseudobdellovibrionaceae bacterium]